MIKKILIKVILKICNEFENVFLRKYFIKVYGIDVGLYSYGCFDPLRFPRNIRIGRYCSFSKTCCFFSRNHGLSFLGLHPYFYNQNFKVVKEERIKNTRFIVEDDVWIGHNATITAKASRIGRGAVIAANAVVTCDVQPYTIMIGNPARILRYRFSKEVIKEIEKTKWWLLDKRQLSQLITDNPKMCFEPEVYFEKEN